MKYLQFSDICQYWQDAPLYSVTQISTEYIYIFCIHYKINGWWKFSFFYTDEIENAFDFDIFLAYKGDMK